ncbi:MAG TPA: CHAT domain-containing protein [Myxococcaceae bacterium]|jgi:tetratricopeptide (TPR) repeat protein
MSDLHGRADEYAEGLLSPDEERAFQEHLRSCRTCQAELEDDLQMRALEERIRAERRRVVPFRRRLTTWGSAGLFAAAAAAVLLWVRPWAPTQPETLLAFAGPRLIEGRVAYAGADRYRAYDPMRGGANASGDRISPEVMARLSRAGDTRGLAAAYLLEGELSNAARELDQAPRSPDADSDQALLELLKYQQTRSPEGGFGQLLQRQYQELQGLENALILLDRVLRRAPDHRQALWNRGLVLRELGLPLAAAASFERAAVLDPEWRQEAQARAAELRRQTLEHQAWVTARRLGYEMLDGNALMPVEEAKRFPGISRVFFHDAVRLATSRERLATLAPLARELDRRFGGDELSRTLEQARAHPFEARRSLLKDYLDFVHNRSALDDAGWRRWLAQARKAGADDLIFGALVLTGRSGKEIGELRRIARSAGSPWFDMLEAETEARAAFDAADTARGERLLVDAIGRCDVRRVPYRCMTLTTRLAQVDLEAHRLQAARAHARQALELAQSNNEWGSASLLKTILGETERLRSRFAQARAYYEEAALETPPEPCELRRDNLLSLAELYVLEGRPADAHRSAKEAGTCPGPLSMNGLIVHVDLFRIGAPVLTEGALRQEIASFRKMPGMTRGEKLVADFNEARLTIDREPARGQALLRSVITEASHSRDDVTSAKVSAYAYTTLLVDSARRGAFGELAPLLVEEQGGKEAPRSCVVAVARDDLRLAIAVHDARGGVTGTYDEHSTFGEGSTLMPPELIAHLADCPEVSVLAQPPLAGAPRVLPPQMAWSYHFKPGVRAGALETCPPDTGGPPRRVVVAASRPPQWLGLPVLSDWELPESTRARDVALLKGPEANPTRVLSELPDATEIQFHVHSVMDRERSDAPLLALTPDPDGRWALTAEDVSRVALRCQPLVLLADCHAGELAEWVHAAWGLPTAFLAAGARAVVASPEDVPDREATSFMDGVTTRIRAGATPAVAVSTERKAWLQREAGSWAADVIVYE